MMNSMLCSCLLVYAFVHNTMALFAISLHVHAKSLFDLRQGRAVQHKRAKDFLLAQQNNTHQQRDSWPKEQSSNCARQRAFVIWRAGKISAIKYPTLVL